MGKYAKRFSIEPMHKEWKTNAFELEKTRVTDPKKIENLLIPIAFVYILAVMEGERKEQVNDVRKPPKKKERLVGLFLNDIRSFAKKLTCSTMSEFKQFINNLLKSLLNVGEKESVG
jgi:hypothetical protein